MRPVLAALLAILLGLQPAGLWASAGATSPVQTQQPPSSEAPRGGPPPNTPAVSFERIKRELGERPPSTAATPLKLDFYVEVTALAPEFQLFAPGEAVTGPVPGAPPTHADMLNLITKEAFRAPPMALSSLAIIGIKKFVEWEANRLKRKRAEEELQRQKDAERERQRKMSGIVLQPPK